MEPTDWERRMWSVVLIFAVNFKCSRSYILTTHKHLTMFLYGRKLLWKMFRCCRITRATVQVEQQQQQQLWQQFVRRCIYGGFVQKWQRPQRRLPPVLGLPHALRALLSRCEERKDGLIQEHHAKIAKRIKAGKPYKRNKMPRFPDESIEMALNMNVDVCVAGQFLRGVAYLPHGSGRSPRRCLVFTHCPETQQKALAMGAVLVGGESLVESIASETVKLPKRRKIDMCLATADMMNHIQTNPAAAKILRHNRLLPSDKKETICSTNEELLEDLYNTIANRYVWYQTERRGIIHLRVGKASLGQERLTENIASVMKGIYAKRPAEHGIWMAKKRRSRRPILATKKRIYVLKAYIRSERGKTLRIHTLTLNPDSQYFLQEMPSLEESEAEVRRLKEVALGNSQDQQSGTTTNDEEAEVQLQSSAGICLNSLD